ncbi:peptidoglycan DD-metalloendopeptidase family protein [Thioalkalivibrio sp. HK1]|uniref:peptidoglycan DD-metalloendopeptidase family protein n=1 Tax=Thioalkalivibrio sp. HK1 TaxID=1469245 RepID=UPI00047156D2|nr:peptidoglycan DD-metalloendopeptidase family protein [Thioalkalivibrio sp. HK1]
MSTDFPIRRNTASWVGVCTLVVIVGLLGGCTQLAPEQFAPVGPPTKPLVPGQAGEYVVKKGDTLYAVGWVFGIDYRELERVNGIEDPRKLKIGQVLLIPERTNLEFAFPALEAEGDRGKRPGPIEQARVEPAKAAEKTEKPEKSAQGDQVPDKTEKPAEAGDASKGEGATSPAAAPAAPETSKPTVIAAAPEPVPPAPPKAPPASSTPPAAAPASKPGAKAEAADSRARTTPLPSAPTRKKPLPAPPSTKVAIARPDSAPPLPTKVDRWTWPTSGKVIGTFKRGGGKGIDIGGEVGQPVKAAAGGEVVYVGNGLVGYGNMIIIKHTEDVLSAYAHNRSMDVREGEFVRAGDPIAEMGSSGTDRVKLHFEIRHRGQPVDPLKRLPR